MKLTTLIVLLFVIQIGLVIFDQIGDPNSPTFNPYGSDTGTQEYAVWNFIFNPIEWNGNGFMTLLLTGLVIGAGVGAGVSFFYRSDLTLLLPVFIAIVGLGTVPIMGLWNFMNREIGLMACTGGSACYIGSLLSAVVCAPLAMYWIFSCIEWWSGRQM